MVRSICHNSNSKIAIVAILLPSIVIVDRGVKWNAVGVEELSDRLDDCSLAFQLRLSEGGHLHARVQGFPEDGAHTHGENKTNKKGPHRRHVNVTPQV